MSVVLLLAGGAILLAVVAPLFADRPVSEARRLESRPAHPGSWLASSAVLAHDRALGLLSPEDYRQARFSLALAHRGQQAHRPVGGRPWLTLLPLAAGAVAIGISLLVSNAVVPRPAGASATGSLGLDAPAGPGSMASPGADMATTLTSANILVDQGRFSEALALYQQVLAAQPRNVAALASLGLVRYQLHDSRGSLAASQAALAVQPDYPPALLVEGLALYATQDRAGALAAWRRFLVVDPSASAANMVRIWISRTQAGLPPS